MQIMNHISKQSLTTATDTDLSINILPQQRQSSRDYYYSLTVILLTALLCFASIIK